MNAIYEPRVTIIPPKISSETEKLLRKLNVAAYARVSTDEEEQESSYEAQISYYTEKITANPEWKMAGIFADEGITGTQAKKRPQFLKMIELCRRKKIDLILTKSVSRFARNTVDCLNYVRELKAIGIGIIFEKENINTLLVENEMLLTIMSCFAQAESESISKNVSWGIRQSFKSGNVPIRYGTLLGYRKGADGKPEIIPEEAEIVREIYRLYLDGMSLVQIQNELTARKIPTKVGTDRWQRSTIKSILQNEKYTGDALLQKTYITDCITKKTKKNNGELPMYLVRNHHEPIIARAEFNRVQEEMARRSSKQKIAEKFSKTEQGRYSAKYALSELLVCGECGAHYRRVTWTAKGYKEFKWRCINRLQYGKKVCHSSPTIDESSLQKAIVSAINEFCNVKEDVVAVLKESVSEVLDPNQNGSVLAAKRRIEELAKNLDELLRLAMLPESAEKAMADIEKSSEEMKHLREFIETEMAKTAVAEYDSEQLKAVLERLEKENFSLTEYNDVAVRQLVERVTVEDKHTVTVTFMGGIKIKKEIEE